jgi:uncharacterized protein (TIGR02996 family)
VKRTFEFVEGSSRKFWHVELTGTQMVTSFGRIGTKGQTKAKDFPSEEAARGEFDRLVAEKLKKGYRETTPPPGPAADPLREALENALADNPDDLASHAAYADYLAEQGDPRGEFIQVQLALEDAGVAPAQRRKLQAREKQLLTKHGKEWLGGIAAVLTDDDSYAFARGWLDTLDVRRLSGPAAFAVARAPQIRLLRRLLIGTMRIDLDEDVWPDGAPADLDEDSGCTDLLAASPYLGNVRVLRVGEEIEQDFDERVGIQERAANVERLVAKMPRLEELRLFVAHGVEAAELFALRSLGNLRVLQLYHQHNYPFEVLAANPALTNLTTLLCHPACYSGHAVRITPEALRALCKSRRLKNLTHLHLQLTQLGDEGVKLIVKSGLLGRLKTLDLRLGCVTDEGARTLAAAPAVNRLEMLNLSRNELTEEGISRLRATGVKLNADDQHEDDDEEWFEVGDYE